MFLISKFMFHAVYLPRNYLQIDQYKEANFEGTYYIFRVGAIGDKVKVEKKPCRIKEGTFLKIWSLESFKLSENILGLFGNSTDLLSRGLKLMNSPFIDPGFEGSLELVIKNFSSKPVDLNYGEVIGKVTFFDIADSHLEAADYLEKEVKKAKYIERLKAAEIINKAHKNLIDKQNNSFI